MSDFIYVNPTAPQTYTTDIVPGSSGVDLSTVSAASFVVRQPDESIASWAAALSNQTTTTLTLTHTYATGDMAIKGSYLLYALLTVPGGKVRTATKLLQGKGEYEL